MHEEPSNGKNTIDELMAQGVTFHAVGDIDRAITVREQARGAASPDDPRYGGILTTLAACYERKGNLEYARQLADEAYQILQVQRLDGDTRAEREFPIAALYVGTIGVKCGMTAEASGDIEKARRTYHIGAKRLDEAWTALRELSGAQPKPLHQHVINASRRVAMGRALAQERSFAGLGVALGSIAMSPFSESPLLVARTSKLSRRGRWHAKAKAGLGGVAATGVAVLAGLPYHAARKTALKIAQKTL